MTDRDKLDIINNVNYRGIFKFVISEMTKLGLPISVKSSDDFILDYLRECNTRQEVINKLNTIL